MNDPDFNRTCFACTDPTGDAWKSCTEPNCPRKAARYDRAYPVDRTAFQHVRIKLALADVPRHYLASFVEHNAHANQVERFGPAWCRCRSCWYIRTRISQYFAPALPKSPPPQAPREEVPTIGEANDYARRHVGDYQAILHPLVLPDPGLAGKAMRERIGGIVARLASFDEAELKELVDWWVGRYPLQQMSLVVRCQSGEIVGLTDGQQVDGKPYLIVQSSEPYRAERRRLFPVVYQDDFPPMVQSFMGKPVQHYFGPTKEG